MPHHSRHRQLHGGEGQRYNHRRRAEILRQLRTPTAPYDEPGSRNRIATVLMTEPACRPEHIRPILLSGARRGLRGGEFTNRITSDRPLWTGPYIRRLELSPRGVERQGPAVRAGRTIETCDSDVAGRLVGRGTLPIEEGIRRTSTSIVLDHCIACGMRCRSSY
jgi:hypothetical protein